MLTQEVDNKKRVLTSVSHRWSRADVRSSATDRKCIMVVWTVMNSIIIHGGISSLSSRNFLP